MNLKLQINEYKANLQKEGDVQAMLEEISNKLEDVYNKIHGNGNKQISPLNANTCNVDEQDLYEKISSAGYEE